MSIFTRQSTKQFRLWLLAAAAMLLLTSIIEAGHIHGTFVDTDDHCVLCQHSVALEKVLATANIVVIPFLLALLALALVTRFTPSVTRRFALIRAPPATLPAH
jgi:hypothetical protein